VQCKRGAQSFLIAGPSTACRLVVFSATFGVVCLEFCVSECVIFMENYTNSKMTDMVLCYGSADGVAFRAQAGCCLRENATFRSRSVDRDQERMPRVLDLEPQILETVEESPLTSTRKLPREFRRFLSLWYVALVKSKGYTPIMFSGCKHCNQTITFADKSFVSR
jgi:hypothetical protein